MQLGVEELEGRDKEIWKAKERSRAGAIVQHKVKMPLKMFFGVKKKQQEQEKKRKEKEREEDRVHSRSRSGASFALGKVRSKAFDMA